MSQSLRYLGLGVLALTAGLLAFEEAKWMPSDVVGPWIVPGIWAGAACLVGGIVLAVLGRVGASLGRGRCVRCGASIRKGQTYCNDHLQETVNEFRDQARDQSL